MSKPDSLAPDPLASFPRLPATASLLNVSQAAFALAWGAEDDFGEPQGNVLGGDWNPAGFGGPGPVGPTGGGGPGGGASFSGQAGAGPNSGAGAGVAVGGAAGGAGIGGAGDSAASGGPDSAPPGPGDGSAAPPAPPAPPSPAPPGGSSCSSSFSANSPQPVRYANGGIVLAAHDLGSNGFGQPWGHTRSYTNKLTGTLDLKQNRNGDHWWLAQTPQLINNGGTDNSVIGVVRVVQETLWFDFVSSAYVPRFYFREKLTIAGSGSSEEFTLLDAAGRRWIFYGFDSTIDSSLRGQFKGFLDPFGHTTTTNYDATTKRLTSFTQTGSSSSSSSSSTPATVGYTYEYFASGDSNGRFQRVTLAVNGMAVRRAEYTYFTTADTFGGSNGDLRTASRQQWNGAAWVELDRTHYRYYRSGDANGFVHGLKYLIGPEAYARLQAAGYTPENITDEAILARYADNYFEYDTSQRVKKEVTRGGAASHTFAYATPSGYSGVNSWKNKTTETLPDGRQWVVYTNDTGLVIFKIFKSGSGGTDLAYEYYQYDDGAVNPAAKGAMTSWASSAAVDASGFTEGSPGLGIALKGTSGNPAYIPVWTFDYDTTSGLLVNTYVQPGNASGSKVKLSQWTYESHTGASQTIYVPSQFTIYQSESGGGSSPAATAFANTWTGDLALTQIVTTWPTISTAQNGSNSANLRTDQFSEYGLPTTSTDERGVVTKYTFDLATSAVVQRIDDANGLALTSDYTADLQGRTTQELGPAHTIDLNGVATIIRRARWTVFQDALREEWNAAGYQAGAGFTLVNPVNIQRRDRKFRLTDNIVVAREASAGPLVAGDRFPQSLWVRWSKAAWDDKDRLLCNRTYFAIPPEGEGVGGIHYLETTYGYDQGFRIRKIAAPDGTLTRTVFDVRGRPIETWIGTDDIGATDADPSGAGTPGNNMSYVAVIEYDDSLQTGDSLVTHVQRYTDDSEYRDVYYRYDVRQRLTAIDGEEGYFQTRAYDGADRVTAVEIWNPDNSNAANRVAKREMFYDDLGRMFKFIRRGVTVGTGATTDDAHSLRDEFWYDPAGNLLKLLRRGRRSFEKLTYDNLNRVTLQYFCYDLAEYNSPTYAAAGTVTGDTVVHQVEWTYDAGSNVTLQTTRERFHDATGTGALVSVSTQPKARVSYLASYCDGLGRTVASVDCGTNGAASFTRPETVPPCSDTALVSRVAYDSAGEVSETADARGIVTHRETDHAGRLVRMVENYLPGATGSDVNKTTGFAYDGAGRLVAMIAKNPSTGDQATRFGYGIAKSATDSELARNDLVKAMMYPDSDDSRSPVGDGGDGIHDRVEFRYNRQGEVKEKKDPAATVHAYEYDKLGRWIHDRVTAFGPNLDQAIKRISRTFEKRGRIEKVTSYDNATVGSGAVKNEVQRDYNEYRQLAREHQEHSGAVVSGTSVKTQYYYQSTDNTVRRTTFYFPNTTRAISYEYGTANAIDDMLSRVSVIKEGTTAHATYSYLGWERRVRAAIVASNTLDWSMLAQSGEAMGDAGDPYIGLDRFGRTEQTRYLSSSTSAERVQYGFDRAGDRTWRKQAVAPDSAQQDEAYLYDGLSQLTRLQRGVLNYNRTAASGFLATSSVPAFEEDFSFDATGNWQRNGTTSTDAYVQSSAGTVQVNQNRLHNAGNEITEVNQSVGAWKGPFAHDAAGNLRTGPLPANMAASWTCTCDAWNRLVKVETTSTQGTYEYDGLDRRIRRTTYSPTLTRELYYSDQWQLLEQREGTPTPAVTRQFLWGLRYPDDLLQRFRASGSESRYALHDYFHVTAAFNAGGAPASVSERFGYDAYGTPRVMTSSWGSTTDTLDWEFRFGAAYYDSETGLYLMRYRYLHPKLGRWVARDPIGFGLSNTNLVVPFDNNPINITDPSGLIINLTPWISPCLGKTLQNCIAKCGGFLNVCFCLQGQVYSIDPQGRIVRIVAAVCKCRLPPP